MNRFWYKHEKCGFEDSQRVSGSLGWFDKNDESHYMYCRCNPPIKLEPYAGKDTSQ